jgi:hypothetical protein
MQRLIISNSPLHVLGASAVSFQVLLHHRVIHVPLGTAQRMKMSTPEY